MELFKKDRRQACSTLFPGSYFVFRHLALQVPQSGVQTTTLPYSLTGRIINELVPWLQNKAQNEPGWEQFRTINEDRIAVVEPFRVEGVVAPTAWWCTNPGCNKFFTDRIRAAGIDNGHCPNCRVRSIVQFPAMFMCSSCHSIDPVTRVQCNECRDNRFVYLTGSAGRWSTFRWRCRNHENFSVMLGKSCRVDQRRMELKSVGGKLYHAENWSKVDATTRGREFIRGPLKFEPSRATVLNVTIARVPVANVNNYYQGRERSTKEPFLDSTGNFMAFVSRIATDAIVISSSTNTQFDEITLHSLEHALMNAAPAVTGLTQEEFGSDLKNDEGQIVFFDNVQGGSGGCRLLTDRRLDRWLEVMRELAECHQKQCEDACRGCLFLPSRICGSLNYNLDRNTVLRLV